MNFRPKQTYCKLKSDVAQAIRFVLFTLFTTFFLSNLKAQSSIIGGTPSVCQGDSAILTASSGFQTYNWSNGSKIQTTTVKQSGKYFITVTDGRGIPIVDSFVFTVNPLPNSTIVGTPYVCFGRSTSLSVGSNFRAILWSNGQRTNEIFAIATGTYSVTVTDANGCTSASSVDVRDGSQSYNALSDTVKICAGDSAVLDATTAFARSYYWNTTDTTPTIIVRDSGRYNVIVSSGQCVNYDTIHVIVLPAPKVNLGIDTAICKGDTLILRAEKSALYTYKWSDGSSNPTYKATTEGVHSVEVKFGNCRATDSIDIAIFNKDPGKIFDTISCILQFPLKPNLKGVKSYRWSTGSTDSMITISKSSNYQVVMSNTKCVVSWFYNMTFKSVPRFNLGNDTLLCQDLKRAELLLKAGFADGTNYTWQDSSKLPTFQAKTTGKYTVVAKNECGEDRDEINLTIKNCYDIFIPTSFSPNGDALNETFKVYPTQNIRKILRFNIFDRWGNLMFTASNFMQDEAEKNAWDGTYNGKALNPSVFIYFVEMETVDGAILMQKGDVTLMR